MSRLLVLLLLLLALWLLVRPLLRRVTAEVREFLAWRRRRGTAGGGATRLVACSRCGSYFQPSRSRGRGGELYCSAECRQLAARDGG